MWDRGREFDCSSLNRATDGAPIRAQPFSPPHPRGTRAPPVRWLLLGGLVLAVLTLPALFVFFNLRWVMVKVYPEVVGTDLRIEAPLQLRRADRFLLPKGTHYLTVNAPGYYGVEMLLGVGNSFDQRLSVDLVPLPGQLFLESEPAGATVRVDGDEVGSTPLEIRNLARGEHTIRLAAERYRPHQEEFEVVGLGRRQVHRVVLEPAWTTLALNSEPGKAELLIDGGVVGKTPANVEVLEGKREIALRLAGYSTWRQELDVVAGEPVDLDTVKLAPAPVKVAVTSEPSGAKLFVDGEGEGSTPLTLSGSVGAKLDLELRLDGYKPASRALVLKKTSRKLHVNLEPLLGEVLVVATPADAEVRVDGRKVATGNVPFRLPVGAHTLTVSRSGYREQTVVVTPRHESTTRLEVALERLGPQLEIVAPDGQRLRRFGPAIFTMGTPRREPGRAPNEVQREVTLTRPYFLAVHEVTVEAYRRFNPGYSLTVEPRQPVVGVSWDQAAAYCNWLSTQSGLRLVYRFDGNRVTGFDAAANGFRLPSEAEWARAARLREDGTMRRYPWGDSWPPGEAAGNYADRSATGIAARIPDYDDGFVATAPVGSFPASADGIFDLGGNAREWTHDVYSLSLSAATNPMGAQTGTQHVIRGAGWRSASVTELRLSRRDYGFNASDDLGFRIARYAD